ncbi:MAG: XTP/dITP diphosphatase [Magnetococcales bacterium]|nr:XTP/dITP diphosphatase [Magnetococcales bacterium]MBF0113751.1 XTP/dITP diphosphatase [Magnetococcales bacterium]
MKIVLATRNKKKTEEIRRILAGSDIELLNLTAFPEAPEVVEDGLTFAENAAKKAVQIAQYTSLTALADDSGLVVDVLQGAPGVWSARYAGPEADDAANLAKLLRDVRDTPLAQRTARFECVMTLACPDGRLHHFAGSVSGLIIDAPRGGNGFGYDPAFVPLGYAQTFAEMTGEQKDSISHRGRALAALAAALHASGEKIVSCD